MNHAAQTTGYQLFAPLFYEKLLDVLGGKPLF